LKSERVDLVAVVQQAIETCRPLLLAAQHELVVTLRDEPCFVVGDSVRLAQVVSNLITNAAKFTAAGGRIEVILDRADGNAVVRVRDNGRGMDAATLANVFDMFYQSTHEGDRSVGGLGIGLALVRSLVALHRGQVEAVSEGRGRGSEFIVRLPCVNNAAPADRARLEGESGPLRTLVDGDGDPADTTPLLLELQRYVATTVYDCEETVARAITRPPDVMLDPAG
jgi:signal transduction histidine kinase